MERKVVGWSKKGIFFVILGLSFLLLNNKCAPKEEGLLTIPQLLQIKYLSQPVWSSDGGKMAFIWDDGGVKDIWVVSLSDGKLSKVSQSRGEIGRPVWSPDGRELIYVQE